MSRDPLQAVPKANPRRVAIHVNPEAERAVRGGHPWLFQDAITKLSHEGAAGDTAVVFDRKNRFLAAGLYDPYSPIRVRLLVHSEPETIAQPLFADRVHKALLARKDLENSNTTGCRLVHGANDRLAGLVIDRYDKSLAIKLDTAAWIPHLQELLHVLHEALDFERAVLRLSRHVQMNEDVLFGLADGSAIYGSPPLEPIRFLENDLQFEADIVRGQKTGFFLDQRENRRRVEGLAGSRKVLNVFAYSGAFSLYAARGGAVLVHSLDLDRAALASAQRHFDLNRSVAAVARAEHDTLQGDAFRLLGELAAGGEHYDLVIIDPPAFARRKNDVAAALSAYERLAGLGLQVLGPDGILVTSSCSSRVTAEEFYNAVHKAARREGRLLHEIERTGHPVDHPIGFKEGAYLKTLFAEVS
jgi:23S rRNA (cytosine1962-C5)-methyltransferase